MLQLVKKPETAHALERLHSLALARPIGTLIGYDELYALLGEPAPLTQLERILLRNRVSKLVHRLNRDLLQAKRLLRSEPNRGYVIATAEQHLAHARLRQRKGRRQFDRALQEYQGLDLRRLTPDQQQQAQFAIEQLGTLLALARRRSQAGLQAAAQSMREQQLLASHLEELRGHFNALQRLIQRGTQRREDKVS
jgi:hypothetical protein